MEGDSPEPSTLMAVRTKTGRKHQIRRQLAGMGHTILGDHLYGSYRHLPPIFKNYPLRPIMLHASGLQVCSFAPCFAFFLSCIVSFLPPQPSTPQSLT